MNKARAEAMADAMGAEICGATIHPAEWQSSHTEIVGGNADHKGVKVTTLTYICPTCRARIEIKKTWSSTGPQPIIICHMQK